MSIFEKLYETGVVPVATFSDCGFAVSASEALQEGGLSCVEITFRTPEAEKCVNAVAKNVGITVGAGTILTVEQAKRAVGAGASFIVSPGTNAAVVEYCLKENVFVIPGVMTPSEVTLGVNLGLSLLKFFPAGQAGGLNMIKALSAPFPDLKFMPSGGITIENVPEYLAFSKVPVVGGSFMMKKTPGEIKEASVLTALAVKKARGL
ncbi:hypothetical protein FACS189490_00460 [Clostridia bacterium]|nr:hypothetical protein FACS189490_00460 [Clostridia bacterium]